MVGIISRTASHGPLHEAASRGDTAKIKELLAQGADANAFDGYGGTPLFNAAANSYSNSIRILAASGKAKVDQSDKNGSCPLHKAAENGHTRAVIALVDCGAMIHIRNRQGETPLHVAARNNHGDCVRKLLELGANPEFQDHRGKDVRDSARAAGAAAALEELKEYYGKQSLWKKIRKLFGK